MKIELGTLPLPSQGSVAPLNMKIVNVPAVIFSTFPHLWMKVHLHVYLPPFALFVNTCHTSLHTTPSVFNSIPLNQALHVT